MSVLLCFSEPCAWFLDARAALCLLPAALGLVHPPCHSKSYASALGFCGLCACFLDARARGHLRGLCACFLGCACSSGSCACCWASLGRARAALVHVRALGHLRGPCAACLARPTGLLWAVHVLLWCFASWSNQPCCSWLCACCFGQSVLLCFSGSCALIDALDSPVCCSGLLILLLSVRAALPCSCCSDLCSLGHARVTLLWVRSLLWLRREDRACCFAIRASSRPHVASGLLCEAPARCSKAIVCCSKVTACLKAIARFRGDHASFTGFAALSLALVLGSLCTRLDAARMPLSPWRCAL